MNAINHRMISPNIISYGYITAQLPSFVPTSLIILQHFIIFTNKCFFQKVYNCLVYWRLLGVGAPFYRKYWVRHCIRLCYIAIKTECTVPMENVWFPNGQQISIIIITFCNFILLSQVPYS